MYSPTKARLTYCSRPFRNHLDFHGFQNDPVTPTPFPSVSSLYLYPRTIRREVRVGDPCTSPYPCLGTGLLISPLVGTGSFSLRPLFGTEYYLCKRVGIDFLLWCKWFFWGPVQEFGNSETSPNIVFRDPMLGTDRRPSPALGPYCG